MPTAADHLWKQEPQVEYVLKEVLLKQMTKHFYQICCQKNFWENQRPDITQFFPVITKYKIPN